MEYFENGCVNYRAIYNYCAVHLPTLNLLTSREDCLEVLRGLSFEQVEVDMEKAARSVMGFAKYRRGAKVEEAPRVFDCSGLTRWLYELRGVWIPRRSIQQREYGVAVELAEVKMGDLIFTSGVIDYYYNDKKDGVGHVGMMTSCGTVIHAASKAVGVVETELMDFIANECFRGARRYIISSSEVVTLKIPSARLVESSDDLRWIVLQQP